jgi:phage terminase small subunit
VSIKRELFADNVAAGMGLSDAYRQAGYSVRMSPGSIASTAFKLRQRPDVCLMVDTRLAVVAESAAVSREQIASELAAVGFASLGDVATWGPDGLRVKDSGALEPGALAAVSEVVEVQTEHGHSIRVKLHDKVGALVKLSALLGYDRPASREPDRVRVLRMSVRRTLPDGATEDVAIEAVEVVGDQDPE